MSSTCQTPACPSFFVREVPIYGVAVLAPMDGFSDLPFRLICCDGLAMSYTEFTNADGILQKRMPESVAHRLAFDASEKPMTFQIYHQDPDRLVDAAKRSRDGT